MLKYNLSDHTFESISNPDEFIRPDDPRSLTIWEFAATSDTNPNLIFTFQNPEEIEAILPNRRRFVPSTVSDDRVGEYAQYNIGTIEAMPEIEDNPISNPEFIERQKLQRDKAFCGSIYDEFLLGNRANTAMSDADVIAQAQTPEAMLTKQLIDSGAVSQLRIVINAMPESFLTTEQKNYFLEKIDNYLSIQ